MVCRRSIMRIPDFKSQESGETQHFVSHMHWDREPVLDIRISALTSVRKSGSPDKRNRDVADSKEPHSKTLSRSVARHFRPRGLGVRLSSAAFARFLLAVALATLMVQTPLLAATDENNSATNRMDG